MKRLTSIILATCLIALLIGNAFAATVNIADFGAKPNDGQNDRAAIQAAFTAAGMNGTVLCNAGTFNCTGQIAINSTGMKLTTASGKQDALIDFSLPVAASNGWVNGSNFAFKGGDISGLEVTQMKLKSSGGIFNASRLDRGKFTFNDFQWGYNSNYYNRLAFYVSGSADGLAIDRNNFHDSESSDRNLEIWGWANGSYNYNKFYLVNDGGHVMNPGHNWQMLGNVGRLLHRMGIEIQQDKYPPTIWPENLVVDGNVFYDWNKPYWDSMGLSVPVAGKNVRVTNNYIKHNAYNGVWGVADSSGAVRGSYGIESPQAPSGQPGGIVEGNTIISERDVMGVSAPGKNTIVRNNKFYGPFAWSVVGGEPGSLGNGNAVETNNLKEADGSKAPTVPGAPTTKPTPTTQPTPLPSLFTLIAKSTTATTVEFSLAGLPAGTASVRVLGVSSVGHEPAPTYTLPSSNIAGPYNTNWVYDFSAEALGVGGIVIGKSNTLLSVQVKAPTTQPAPPPPPPAPSETIINGLPWDLVFPVAPDGKVGQPTTRKAA